MLTLKRLKNKSEWNKPSIQEFRRPVKEEINANSRSLFTRNIIIFVKFFLEGEDKIDKPENYGIKKIMAFKWESKRC